MIPRLLYTRAHTRACTQIHCPYHQQSMGTRHDTPPVRSAAIDEDGPHGISGPVPPITVIDGGTHHAPATPCTAPTQTAKTPVNPHQSLNRQYRPSCGFSNLWAGSIHCGLRAAAEDCPPGIQDSKRQTKHSTDPGPTRTCRYPNYQEVPAP